MRPHVRRITVLLMALLVSGCTSINGPQFTQITDTPPGKAIVYFYKAGSYGKDVFTIGINGMPITKLIKGGYYPYIAEPGKLEVTSSINFRVILPLIASAGYFLQPDSKIALNIEAGKTYYVKQTSGLNLKLIEMLEADALIELEGCKLLPPFAP